MLLNITGMISKLFTRREAEHTTTSDARITCVMCRDVFVWSESEQRRFASKAWAPPKRCERCRAWRLLPRRSRGLPPGTKAHDILFCNSCGEQFALTAKTRARLAAQKYQFSNGCGSCRHPKRASNESDGRGGSAARQRAVQTLVDELEGRRTELFLTGDPLANVVSDAIDAGDIGALIRARTIVDAETRPVLTMGR